MTDDDKVPYSSQLLSQVCEDEWVPLLDQSGPRRPLRGGNV